MGGLASFAARYYTQNQPMIPCHHVRTSALVSLQSPGSPAKTLKGKGAKVRRRSEAGYAARRTQAL